MVFKRFYYLVKPFIPLRLRLALRRYHAQRRRNVCRDLWPIDPNSAEPPPGWTGWPDGKQFAVVLTHDVEGSRGFSRVERLMNVDRNYGFRSSFNFVPHGEYRLTSDLCTLLESSGCEVGVHGLEHDGRLYRSKREFAEKAKKIRAYVKAWGASGFRSPLMQHRLGWLHELGVEYDASTFDTDPFEPEPDGYGTLFPFWVPGPNGTGFVELPYTLVQDSTLFNILGEDTIDIWKSKLDWVASHGGMVLLNTHPDYMSFDQARHAQDEFPVSKYEEVLSYIAQKYKGAYWHATAREVARYYMAQHPPAARNSRKKICMITHSHYEGDNRVRRYAETLARRGDHVDVVALDAGNSALPVEKISGVTVYRIQRRERNERSKWTYALRLSRFLFASAKFVARRHQLLRYDLFHVHNMPDFLVFAAWYPKLTGARIILDIHDIVPELFANKFHGVASRFFTRLLQFIEKISISFADHVIVSNDLWRERLISRSVQRDKTKVFVNHVDPAMFYKRPRTRNDGKFIILYPGVLQRHQGLDVAIEAFSQIRDRVPNAEMHIYGRGDAYPMLQELTRKLGLTDRVKFCEPKPLDQIVDVIANADLGVVPKLADSFGNEAYSTKIMEFMSQGVPVLVSKTKIDSYYFNDKVVRFFESGNSTAMAQAIVDLVENPQLRKSLIDNAYEYVRRNSWNEKRAEYLSLVDSLLQEDFAKFNHRSTDIQEAIELKEDHPIRS